MMVKIRMYELNDVLIYKDESHHGPAVLRNDAEFAEVLVYVYDQDDALPVIPEM